MTIKVILPKSGMGIEEGTVARWLKREGDKVQEGDPLVEIETAKALQQVHAPAAGVLVKKLLAEGETALINTPIALIDDNV